MLRSDQLKNRRVAASEEAEAISALLEKENRKPTAEETTKFKSLVEEVKALAAQIDDAITLETARRDAPAKPPVKPALDSDHHTVSTTPRYASLKAFRAKTFGGSVQEAEKAAYRSGKWLQAAILNNADALKWCQEHGVFAYGTKQVIYNVHEESSSSTGGVLVPEEWERSIIDLREEYGAFRRLARIAPMTTDTLYRARRTGGLTAYFVGESGAFTESTKGWDNVSLVAKKVGVLAKYSTELAEDAIISIADDLANEAAYAFAVLEDTVGFSGVGSAAHGGIVGVVTKFTNGAATLAGVVNAAATHDNFAEIDADDIDNLVAKLPLYARRGARFYIGPVGKALSFDPILRAAGGNTQGDVANGMPARYLGYPIEEVIAMPNSSTGNYDEQPMILFGRLELAATMGTRRGITLQTLNELYAASGQIGLIASERFDINVHDVGDATTVGPIVALHGETS